MLKSIISNVEFPLTLFDYLTYQVGRLNKKVTLTMLELDKYTK